MVQTLNPCETPLASATRPELTLLITVARVDLDPNEQNLLRDLLAGPLDWVSLIALAERHSLEPLLFRHLHEHGDGLVSADLLSALREDCKRITRRNLILALKLQAISSHLRSRGIEHIAYKGPLLAESCYGNLALRVFHDLDLIVPQPKLGPTRDALAEIGFCDQYGLSRSQQAVSFSHGFEHPFTNAGIDLDLHWRVVQKFKARALDMDGMWQRVQMGRLFESEIPVFRPEDNLIALCLHAGHHGWTQLSHMCDIAQLLRTYPEMDWEIVKSHLGDSNTRRIVHVCFNLLQRHWGARIPEEIMARAAADAHVARLADRVEQEIWPALDPQLTTSNLRWMLQRTAGESLVDRFHLLAGSLFHPAIEDFEIYRLPRLLAWLYPVLRFARLVGKGAASSRRSRAITMASTPQ
jgi:putative nucleotidyltransferase-like protein